MSAVVTVRSVDMCRALSTLRPLFPKGSSEMPIGLHMEAGVLKIVCLQGLVYQASVPVDDNLAINHATVMYYDISTLLPSTGDLELEFTPVGVSLCGHGIEAEFPLGYSVVEEQDFSKLVFSSIANSGFSEGLNRLLNMNLEKLYNQISPIAIHGEISLQRFQNVWVQVRSLGLPFTSVLDSDHVKLLIKFAPLEVCTSIPGTLVFKNSVGIMQLPCKPDNDSGKITDFMQDLGEPVQLTTKSYLERVKQIAKVDSKTQCKITLYKSGLKTTVTRNNTSVSVSTGETDSEVLQVCHLPMQVWLTYLRGLDSETIQILIGGGKICLRTQSMIIVARVLL